MALVAVVSFAVASWPHESRAPEPPNGLTPEVLRPLEDMGWRIEADEEATTAASETAIRLAARSGPDENEPLRHVEAVSLAHVTHAGEDFGLVWVVYSEDVRVHCFGGHSCEGDLGRELDLIAPETLQGLLTTVY